MSFLNIYLQGINLDEEQERKDFISACSQSNFDIICVPASGLKRDNLNEFTGTDQFDIFHSNMKVKLGKWWGTFIAVRKNLSAYVNTEWGTEASECVWITVSLRGCRRRLHVACVNFRPPGTNIDSFTETLTSLKKTHVNDEFLVVGEFLVNRDFINKKYRQAGISESSITGAPENEVRRILLSSILLASLGQFNNIEDKNDELQNLVFSSIPVTVVHCPQPLSPVLKWLCNLSDFKEHLVWYTALQFHLNIGLLEYEYCKTISDSTEENGKNLPSIQQEASQKDVNVGTDVIKIIDGFLQKKCDDINKLLPELIGEKFEHTVKELKAVQEECDRMSKEYLSAKSASESLYTRMERLEGGSKQFANLEERLKTLEERTLTSWGTGEERDALHNVHPTRIKLTRPGYYTIPSLEDLIDYIREDGSCVVPRFTIGRHGYGNVHYSCEMDVAGLDLDNIVHLLNKEVIMYPEEVKKPEVGEGLNRKARVTFDKIWPLDKTTKQRITDPERLAAMDYEGKLRRKCDKQDTKFIEYRPQTGSWVFKVADFSKYCLSDSGAANLAVATENQYM